MNTLPKLIDHAHRLRQCAFPHNNAILTVLTGLIEYDLQVFLPNGGLGKDHLSTIAQRLGLAPEIVTTTFERQIANDIRDYSSFYESQVRAYENSDYDDTKVSSFIAECTACDTVPFILHKQLQLWSPDAGSLDDWYIDDPIEDVNSFEAVVRGYLLVKKSAFSTTLELLERSHSQQWGNWTALWSYF